MRMPGASRPFTLLATPVLGALLCLGSGAARAEDPPTPVPPPAPERAPASAVPAERLGVEMSLSAVVEAVARKTGASFLWDPQSKMLRERQVALTRELLRDDALGLPLLRRVLTYYDQALVPMGEPARPLYAIMDARTQGALMRLRAEVVELDETSVARLEAMDGVFVTATIRAPGLTNLRDLRQALSRLVTGNNIGSVTEVPDADAVVVTDFAPSVAAVYRTVQQIARVNVRSPGSGDTVRTVRLEHASAMPLAALLAQIFAPTPLTQVQLNNGMAPSRGVRILPDERSNQVVVSGTSAEIQAVQAVIATLDVPAPPR